jgi:hypothetical protein
MFGMCYILCNIGPMYYRLIWEKGGYGGVLGVQGWSPRFVFFWHFYIHFWQFFQHMVFTDGFLILVKELGLLTNLSQWIRCLYVV